MRPSASFVAALPSAVLLVVALAGCAPASTPAPPVDDAPPATPRVRVLVDGAALDGPARYGDALRVVVDGLPPGVEARVDTHAASGSSWAVFATGDDGAFDLGADAPVDGTWEGVDVDGFLWSTTDPPFSLTLDLAIDVAVSIDGEEVVAATIERRYVNEGVVSTSIDDGTIQGVLNVPPGDGPFPAVLVFGGSEGGLSGSTFLASYLASLGYASFAVAYFGTDGVPANLVEVPLEILAQDLAFLAARPEVDGERIAVTGGSRGGELALLLAAHYPDVVRATIATVPSGVVWGGLTVEPTAAWTKDGAPLPFVPSSPDAQADVVVDADGAAHVSLTPVFHQDLDDAPADALAAATIPVEQAGGPILLVAGADDALWPSCRLAQIAMDRLVAAGHTDAHGDALLCLDGAGHAIGVPGWSTVGPYEHWRDDMDAYLMLGGTPAGTGRAQRIADDALRAFLARALAD